MEERARHSGLTHWIGRLSTLPDASPPRTAAAFAIGVFLSFSPFFGLQIATGLLLSLLLRLNKLVVFAGLCANLPWLMVPWYVLTTTIGAAVLGVPLAADAGDRIGALLDLPVYRAAFWQQALALVRPVVWPFILGSTLGAAIVAAASYVVVNRTLTRMRASPDLARKAEQ